VGWFFLGLILCGAGMLVARFGLGHPTHEGYNGIGPPEWKIIGRAISTIGIVAVLVGFLG
jgi:hypothetical protein